MKINEIAKILQVLERFIQRMEKESIPRQQQQIFLKAISKEFKLNLSDHNIQELFHFFGNNKYNIINFNKTA